MNKHDEYIAYIMQELVKHINNTYVNNKSFYRGYLSTTYETMYSYKKWAAKEFYFYLSECHPKTPTDLYLSAERFVKFLDNNAYRDMMFSVAYDVAVELYDFVMGVL